MKHWLRYLMAFTIIVSLCISLLPLGCGGPAEGSIEWLTQMNDESTAPDTDSDGLKDDVEEHLGTDPNHRDSDRDGLTDKYEIFNLADETGSQSPVDQNENGISAALDADESSSDCTAYNLPDSDCDGIPNKWEHYGYTYNIDKGKFEKWYVQQDGEISDGPYYDDQGNPIAYYKTDPTQTSTDQDPYSDSMEASGLNMDKSVVPPGNSPTVPAYPDIYVSMTSYEVSPVGTITNSRGGQAQDSWSNTVTDERSSEHHWDVSGTITAKIGVSSLWNGGQVSVTASGGGQYGTSHTTTDSTSGLSSSDWNEATTTDPSQAAKLILSLLFENRGTATAQNVIPSVSLILGDKGISTYTLPDDKKINVLGPGETFPASGYWVIGDDDANEIVITMDELRSIQLGAPLLLSVPQISADVKQPDGQGGWTATAKWEDYKPRIDGVCARLSVDVGGGQMKDYYVYATDPKDTGPVVTLKDIVLWVAGIEEGGDGSLSIMGESMDNCRFGFSSDNLQDVIDQLGEMGDGANLLDVVVKPGWQISIKTAPATNDPEIVWAAHDAASRQVAAYVIDYYQISEVQFESTPGGDGIAMTDSAGSGIYTVILPADYSITGEEVVWARNDREYTATEEITIHEAPPTPPTPPIWGMFHYDAQHTGRSPYSGPATATQKWQFQAGDSIRSSPSIDSDGNIYFGGANHKLYAVNPNGDLKWTYGTGDWVYSSPAIASDGTIYVGSEDKYLYAINPDGTLKWKYQTGGIIDSSPAIGTDGTIYVGSEDKYLYAIKPDGTLKWKYQTGGIIDSSPAIGTDGTIYFGSTDGNFHALNSDGTPKWPPLFIGQIQYSSPAIGPDGSIYIGTFGSGFYCIQPNGQTKWSTTTYGFYIMSSPAIGTDGTIYFGSIDNNYLYAVKASDGSLKWEYQTGDVIESSPAIGSDGTIYVGSEDKYLYAINPDGSLKWRYLAGDKVDSSPAIGADGTLYIGSDDGNLYAIQD